MIKSNENDKKIEKVIEFLVEQIKKSGINEKPVIFHSVRVGMYLHELGYDKDIVIAGLLHDLIEDSVVEISEIKEQFGGKVAEIICAVSFDSKIEDKFKRDKEMFRRCLAQGKEALIVKTADILDNSSYFHLAENQEDRLYLLGKLKYFNNLSNELIRDEQPWKDLNQKYEKIKFYFEK